MSSLQSIHFDRQYYTLAKAKAYMKRHHHPILKIDMTPTFIKFRQQSPSFSHYFTKIPYPGVHYIIGLH